MNPTRWLSFIVLLLLVVVPGDGQETKRAEVKRFAEVHYPIQRGFRWYYRINDLKDKAAEAVKKPPQIVVITAESEQTFTINKKNAQKEWTEEVVGYNIQVAGRFKTLPDGKIMPDIQYEQVLIADDGVYKVSGAGKVIKPPLRIVKKDARKGDVWSVQSESENALLKGDFVADVETIQVPAGKFETVVVRSRDFQIGTQKMQLDTWYAAKVGMVKQHVRSGNHEVIMELEKFEGK